MLQAEAEQDNTSEAVTRLVQQHVQAKVVCQDDSYLQYQVPLEAAFGLSSLFAAIKVCLYMCANKYQLLHGILSSCTCDVLKPIQAGTTCEELLQCEYFSCCCRRIVAHPTTSQMYRSG